MAFIKLAQVAGTGSLRSDPIPINDALNKSKPGTNTHHKLGIINILTLSTGKIGAVTVFFAPLGAALVASDLLNTP